MSNPARAVDYRNGMDIESDNFHPASAYGYRNGMDIESDNFHPASAYGYRNGLDIQSDNYTPASDYAYRNGMDVASDNFNPATLGNYKNGMDIASDQASAARQWRERMARATASEQTRERNRFASMAQESGGATFDMRALRKAQDARELAAYQARLSSLPVQYASAYDPAPARAAAARNGALLNYLSGQGSMALGGVVSAGVMLGTNDVVSASIASDALEPIDSLLAPMGGGAASRLSRVRGSKTVSNNNLVGNSFDDYVAGTKLRGLDERGLLVRQERLPTPDIDGRNYVKPDYTIYRHDGKVAAYADAKTGVEIPFDAQARGLIEWSTVTQSKTLIYYTPDGTTPISPHLLNYARQQGIQIKQVGVK